VLAGVNGAGKSSVGGGIIEAVGQTWFNPDSFSRELMAKTGSSKASADSEAWSYGKTRLEAAITDHSDFAFETTLGGNTIPNLLARAALTHDVIMIYCGLSSAEMHIERVKRRVQHGGHDIPTDKIRQRWLSSRNNLIELLPKLCHLQVFDNSAEAALGDDVPYPLVVLEFKNGIAHYPAHGDLAALESTPGWAKPIVAAALRLSEQAGSPTDAMRR
jgi:predicted ABC-type ATPase